MKLNAAIAASLDNNSSIRSEIRRVRDALQLLVLLRIHALAGGGGAGAAAVSQHRLALSKTWPCLCVAHQRKEM